MNSRWLKAFLIACLVGLTLQTSMRADQFMSDGVKIHYVTAGTGDAVILIHGLNSSARLNWETPGIIAALAKNYRVVALDCRGHGDSDRPTGADDYGVKMVTDVVRLMDHLRLSKAHIVGYSMGGMIALKLATLHPERVNTTVLGGWGWLKEGSPLAAFWGRPSERGSGAIGKTPEACTQSLGSLAISESSLRGIKTGLSVIIGEHDPVQKLYVAPLKRVRPEVAVRVIPAAGHLNCMTKPEFKKEIQAALAGRTTR